MVTVGIPLWRAERWVAPVLKNMAEQGLGEGSLEVLCLRYSPEGEPDAATREAVDAAMRIYPWVRDVELPGSDFAAARNAAAREARGDLLYLMDADDELAPGSLGELAARMRDERLDLMLLSGEPEYATEELARERAGYRDLMRRLPQDGVATGREALRAQAAAGRFSPCAPLMMCSVAMLRACGARFAEGILNEDNLFALGALLGAERVGVDLEPRYRYRVREGSMSAGAMAGAARLESHATLLGLFLSEAARLDGEGDAATADAVRDVATWFCEVCVREGGSCGIGAERLAEPGAEGLAATSAVAAAAARERARAEAAEAELASVRSELDAARAGLAQGRRPLPLRAARRLASLLGIG